MQPMKCNYKNKVKAHEIYNALSAGDCAHCGITARELLEKGQYLEVCAEEFASDIASGERILTPIALCPACHQEHHADARGQHNPCMIKARLSREFIG